MDCSKDEVTLFSFWSWRAFVYPFLVYHSSMQYVWSLDFSDPKLEGKSTEIPCLARHTLSARRRTMQPLQSHPLRASDIFEKLPLQCSLFQLEVPSCECLSHSSVWWFSDSPGTSSQNISSAFEFDYKTIPCLMWWPSFITACYCRILPCSALIQPSCHPLPHPVMFSGAATTVQLQMPICRRQK